MSKAPDTKVSVIIPVFNTQNELPQCLESIVSQTLKDIEIIVVDDGNEAKPKVKDVIKKNFKKDKRIKIARHSINEGLIESRRTGIIESCGEYIFWRQSGIFGIAMKIRSAMSSLVKYTNGGYREMV